MNDTADTQDTKNQDKKERTKQPKLSETDILKMELKQAQENERRARADYQNLVRRTQDERAQLIKLATKSFVADLLQPLAHLSLASQQLNDQGLNMVIQQLWQVLDTQGLKEINPLGQKFDLLTMEVVDKEEDVDENEGVVVKVVKAGYSLNGEVIQHAKVVIGKKE